MTAEDFARRMEAAIGKGWRSRLARAVGRDASSIRRWDEPPEYAVAILEFLENTPKVFWARRWLS